FAGATTAWLAAMPLEREPFLASRAQEFLTAAAQFDAGRQLSDHIGSFVHHIEGYQRQEPEGSGVVRIMTIHQAKGLTLDMTIVSGLDAEPIAKDDTAGLLALEKNHYGNTWGLLLPASDVSKEDPVLNAARTDLLATSAYGELCAAYVAMTRPRHALYVLTKKLKENSSSKNFARLLALTLGYTHTVFEAGARDWFLGRSIVEKATSAEAENIPPLPLPLRGTPHSLGPSRLKTSSPTLFVLSSDAARIGTEVHSALAQIQWIEGLSSKFAHLPRSSREILESFLAKPEAVTLFAHPLTPHVLWRERAFECTLDDQWFAGVFDRVVIQLGADGQPTSAEVIDFKTESSDAETLQKRHASQMAIYRRAAALLLGLDEASVTARVIGVS
ncbi:MAG TPA: 3'-5' exonuclease, partial [Chthoniobacterales bacterium]